jgi:hypothetical protein
VSEMPRLSNSKKIAQFLLIMPFMSQVFADSKLVPISQSRVGIGPGRSLTSC